MSIAESIQEFLDGITGERSKLDRSAFDLLGSTSNSGSYENSGSGSYVDEESKGELFQPQSQQRYRTLSGKPSPGIDLKEVSYSEENGQVLQRNYSEQN